jgi:transcriptional regulator with XRE-family HTH domain
MVTRTRRVDVARARGAAATEAVLRELRSARIERNIASQALAATLGWSASRYSRFERGLATDVSIEAATIALAAVGLDLSVRIYPGGSPLRDAAHAALIERLRARCHPTIRLTTEVPLPSDDQRAWDVGLVGRGWRHWIEVETRPTDRQAMERRIALKTRDGAEGGVSLLLLDSRHNRDFIRIHSAALAERFPIPATVALAAVKAGVDPGAGSVIVL